jgi:RHS repeat-associated protein
VWLDERPASLPVPYLFTAKEFDPETGFYDFGARYLDPRFSKWMSADPALGSYLPGTGAAVGYQSPALANAWRGHPDLRGLGGTFTPPNLALYGYGHQNPATFWDPDGEEPLVCTPENVRGEYRSKFFATSADYSNPHARSGNDIAIAWAGPIFGVLPALGRLLGVSEEKVAVLAEANFQVASTTTVVMARGGPSSVTAAMRRPAASATNPNLRGLTPQPGTRGTGVSRAAQLEVELVQRTGSGTIDWNADEIAFIKQNGRLPRGIVGHHINSVVPYDDWQGDPRNIMFVRG